MRTLYLIRHGRPRTGQEHTCGYAGDIPLSTEGLRQAGALAAWSARLPLTAVFSSPLLRAEQTARVLAGDRLPVRLEPDLREAETGDWTGLPFDEIRRRWPEIYASRGEHLGTVPPPGGESFQAAGDRMAACLEKILAHSQGDVAVVAHGGVNRAVLCRTMGRPLDGLMALRQPWGGISALEIGDGSAFQVLSVGLRPGLPNWEALWERYSTPAPVRAHCAAVARCALGLAEQIDFPIDRDGLRVACLLHDLLRTRPDHARACAALLDREGWPKLAGWVAVHHDLPEGAGTEASLLYLADKLVQGTCRVTLEERFRASREKCRTPEAVAAWQSRYDRALRAAARLRLTLE